MTPPILKQKDSLNEHFEQLEKIKSSPNLPTPILKQVEQEIKRLKSGNRGEQDSAYFIDFHYKDAKKSFVLHDLRMEYGDRVAQIDHLIINRCLEFYVLETKHYAQGLKITEDGEFLTKFKNQYVSIESPIEQAQRHIKVLEQLVLNEIELPKRLGFSLKPKFRSYVLISPKSRLIRPNAKQFNTDTVIKADQFYQQFETDMENRGVRDTVGALAKILNREALEGIAVQVLAHHKPLKPDYYKKFGIDPTSPKAPSPPKRGNSSRCSKYFCWQCKVSITPKAAMYCFGNKAIFGGKAYCFNCQQSFK